MFFRQHTDVVQSHERALQKSLPKALCIVKINILLEFLIKKLTLESIIKYQFLCTKMALSIKNFFSKCGHIISLLECFTQEFRGIFRTLSKTPFRKKCPYSEFSWFVFSRIRTEYEILRISPYSVRMWENKDQKSSEYGHFLRSGVFGIQSHLIRLIVMIPLNIQWIINEAFSNLAPPITDIFSILGKMPVTQDIFKSL